MALLHKTKNALMTMTIARKNFLKAQNAHNLMANFSAQSAQIVAEAEHIGGRDVRRSSGAQR